MESIEHLIAVACVSNFAIHSNRGFPFSSTLGSSHLSAAHLRRLVLFLLHLGHLDLRGSLSRCVNRLPTTTVELPIAFNVLLSVYLLVLVVRFFKIMVNGMYITYDDVIYEARSVRSPFSFTKRHIIDKQRPKPRTTNPVSWARITNLPLTWSTETSFKPGLLNEMKNSFITAALQCLFHLPPFSRALLDMYRHGESRCCHYRDTCPYCAVVNLAWGMSIEEESDVSPKYLVKNFEALRRGVEQYKLRESTEFIRYLLRIFVQANKMGCHTLGKFDDVPPGDVDEDTCFDELFGVIMEKSMKCHLCDYIYRCDEYTRDLVLNFNGTNSVQEAIEEFCSAKEFSADNTYKCSHCRHFVPVTRSYRLRQAPNVLTLFPTRCSTGNRLSMSYPAKLNLGPSLYGKPEDIPVMYSLTGVIVRIDESDVGYETYVKNVDGSWSRRNDFSRQVASIGRVLSQNPYTLFYLRNYNSKERPKRDVERSPTLGVVVETNLLRTLERLAQLQPCSMPKNQPSELQRVRVEDPEPMDEVMSTSSSETNIVRSESSTDSKPNQSVTCLQDIAANVFAHGMGTAVNTFNRIFGPHNNIFYPTLPLPFPHPIPDFLMNFKTSPVRRYGSPTSLRRSREFLGEHLTITWGKNTADDHDQLQKLRMAIANRCRALGIPNLGNDPAMSKRVRHT